MPKMRTFESPYDPIAADLAREVAAAGRLPATNPRTNRNGTVPVEPRAGLGPVAPVVGDQPTVNPAGSSITKRFVLSRAEDDDLNAFLLRLQQAASTKVPLSVIVRALLSLALRSEGAILDALAETRLRFPSTHDALAQGQFEDAWTSLLGEGLFSNQVRSIQRCVNQRSPMSSMGERTYGTVPSCRPLNPGV